MAVLLEYSHPLLGESVGQKPDKPESINGNPLADWQEQLAVWREAADEERALRYAEHFTSIEGRQDRQESSIQLLHGRVNKILYMGIVGLFGIVGTLLAVVIPLIVSRGGS